MISSIVYIRHISLAVTIICAVCAVATPLNSKVAVHPAVVAVYPSGETVHENLLRISVRFSSPQSEMTLPEVTLLRDDGGRQIEQAFDRQAVWSTDNKVLTLLLSPGRVKTGLIAHERYRRALVEGERVALALDGKIIKKWRVIATHHQALDPKSWKPVMPAPRSLEPIVISLGEPIDAMDVEYIVVIGTDGKRLEGSAVLDEGETRWRFFPTHAWAKGDYQVIANPRLEAACGNSVARPFETSSGAVKGRPEIFRIGLRLN